MVQRKSRSAGHLVLFDQAMAGGGPAAAPSGGDLSLGGRVGPLSRLEPSRRHLQQPLPDRVVSKTSAAESERQREEPLSRSRDRRAYHRSCAKRRPAARQSRVPSRRSP